MATSVFETSTFWDIDVNTLDYGKHKVFIIRRVLEYGLWTDIERLFKLYGLQEIIEVIEISRPLQGKAGAFAKEICKLNENA
jgi:hypothetical protein